MEIVVEVVCSLVIAEKYSIESLPDNFAELSDFEKYNYLAEHGVNVADNETYSNVENVNVNWEG